ncbi:TonB-dependent receptor plug domain-containing protein [Zymomonas mobilis]|uniref:TonB-dependent receptor plug domain-containing protein n=1 Tax=Zymomonas mobilis TaxID=542 RepID=UPI0039EA4768
MKRVFLKGGFFVCLSSTFLQYPTIAFASETSETAAKSALNNNIAENPSNAAGNAGDAIIVTGTRETGKKARESISPIDIISAKQLAQTGMPSLRDALTQLLPSLTVPNGGYDSGALTDSLSLRGLSPNETLVLVDGKRRHTTANIYANPGPQQGSTPVDIDMIPMAAIDHIEVLRDGASAQYGSDAVAGVVNIILKKQDHGFHAQTLTGITAAKDGFQQGVYLDGGTKLGSRGYLHVSGDFLRQNHTYRSAADLRTGTKDNKLLGQPEQTRESFAIKGGYEITDNIEAYGLATYAHRSAGAYQNYRLPSSLTNYPGYAAIYPNGYSPIETINENDWEIMAGLKGKIKGWNWDVSSVYGRDYDNIGLKDSANLQLSRDTGRTPTTFKGVQRFNNQQWSNAIDFSKAFHIDGWPHEINVAGGATHRYESYTIGAGSADSTYGSGSDALPGTAAANAGKFSRNVFGGYFDVATHLVKQLQIDVAGRYEHYSDVGDTKTGKVALRYDPFKWLGFRATLSNAFHAPTLAQEYYSAVTLSPTAAHGIISASSPGALANGAQKLKPERSTNITAGVTFEPIKRLVITADLYQIKLRDQILPGGNVYGDQALTALAMNGFTLPSDASSWATASLSTHWFANVASTRTRGIDITATYPTYLGDIGRIDWSVAANVNRTILTHQSTDAQGNDLLTAQSIAYITTAYPRSKIIWGGQFTSGDKKWIVGLHEIRWGKTTSQLAYYKGVANTSVASAYDFFKFLNQPKFVTNLDITYRVNPKLALTIGANNLFNARPSRVPVAHRYLGVPQYNMSTSQLGMNGGFYYFKVDVSL